MKKNDNAEKIFLLTVYDINGDFQPISYASRDREKCVEKAYDLIKMTNDPDSEFGWNDEELEEIHEKLKKNGFYNDHMTFYVIEETQLM